MVVTNTTPPQSDPALLQEGGGVKPHPERIARELFLNFDMIYSVSLFRPYQL